MVFEEYCLRDFGRKDRSCLEEANIMVSLLICSVNIQKNLWMENKRKLITLVDRLSTIRGIIKSGFYVCMVRLKAIIRSYGR